MVSQPALWYLALSDIGTTNYGVPTLERAARHDFKARQATG